MLIILYLLSSPRKSIVQINARGGSSHFLPTKCKTLLIQTFPSVSHENKESNYHIGSNSTYRNVCQFTESLRLTTYIIRSNSKYYNVYEFTRLLLLAIRISRVLSQNAGGSPSFNLAVSKISKFIYNRSSAINEKCNFIFSYGVQWPSDKNATHQGKLTESKIQWPPEKVATMWTVANSN